MKVKKLKRGAAGLLLWCAAAGGAVRCLTAQQRGIDVRHYGFRIAFSDTGGTISGTASVVVRRAPAAGDTLDLDLVGLTVDSVWVQRPPRYPTEPDSTVRPAVAYDGRVLRVPLGSRAGRDDRVVVFYHGVPRDGLVIRASARGRRSLFADNWPDRARYWLPTVDHPGDKADVEWTIQAPRGWRVVANGVCNYLAIGAIRARCSEAHPIPTYTMVLGADQMMTVSQHRPAAGGDGGIPIEVWAYPEDSAFADSVPFRRATEIVETMQRLVGPFPYEKLAHVQSSTRYGGMENSTAIFYDERGYVQRRMGEGVVRHETAHQWFGDAVTERDWRHLWLSEGFASYFDLVIGAALDGDSVLSRGMRAAAESYRGSNVVDRPIVDTAATDLMGLLNANNYQKGAWVLHMLRALVGDSAFFRGVRDYYATYRDSSVLSQQFQRKLERASGRQLDWFFRQWLWQPGYAQLDVRWAVDNGRNTLELLVSQTQSAAWGRFRVPGVEVVASAGDSVLLRRTFELDRTMSAQRLSFPLGGVWPTSLRVDPDGRLLLTATVARGPVGAQGR